MDRSVLTEEQLKAMPEYLAHRQLPDGRWIAGQRMYATWGLMVDLDEVGYAHRYCYEHLSAAIRAMEVWDGEYPAPG